jgi:hypothetical protein
MRWLSGTVRSSGRRLRVRGSPMRRAMTSSRSLRSDVWRRNGCLSFQRSRSGSIRRTRCLPRSSSGEWTRLPRVGPRKRKSVSSSTPDANTSATRLRWKRSGSSRGSQTTINARLQCSKTGSSSSPSVYKSRSGRCRISTRRSTDKRPNAEWPS